MKVVMADLPGERLASASAEVIEAAGGGPDILAVGVDVSRIEEVTALKERVFDTFGEAAVLMNNAGIGGGLGKPWESYDRWRRILEVNLWGVVHGVHAFVPALIDQAGPSAIINTGSKQGITTPPGDTAYNVSKAGVKVLTEGLAHTLRNTPGCQVSAHLFVPGFTFTGLTRPGEREKPAGAWTAEQAIDFALERMAAGDFYIICPDNEVTREVDNARIEWAAQDISHNRPPLSRWHPDWKGDFADFLAQRT
jgi:NAD(P)-dependent dehydrogenase (short-subunit alcohol dehydrogenase family)